MAEISTSNATAGVPIEIKNLSMDGDLSYIKMNGEGIFDQKLFVNKDFMATQKSFKFTYSKPGIYQVEVVTEETDFMSNTNRVSAKYIVKVLPDPSTQQ